MPYTAIFMLMICVDAEFMVASDSWKKITCYTEEKNLLECWVIFYDPENFSNFSNFTFYSEKILKHEFTSCENPWRKLRILFPEARSCQIKKLCIIESFCKWAKVRQSSFIEIIVGSTVFKGEKQYLILIKFFKYCNIGATAEV